MRTAAAKWLILIFWETAAPTVFTRKIEASRSLVCEQHVFKWEHHICKLTQSCYIQKTSRARELPRLNGWFSFSERQRPPLYSPERMRSLMCKQQVFELKHHICKLLPIMLYFADKYTKKTTAAKWLIPTFWETKVSTVSTRKNEACRSLMFEQHVFELEHHICKLPQSCYIQKTSRPRELPRLNGWFSFSERQRSPLYSPEIMRPVGL